MFRSENRREERFAIDESLYAADEPNEAWVGDMFLKLAMGDSHRDLRNYPPVVCATFYHYPKDVRADLYLELGRAPNGGTHVDFDFQRQSRFVRNNPSLCGISIYDPMKRKAFADSECT